MKTRHSRHPRKTRKTKGGEHGFENLLKKKINKFILPDSTFYYVYISENLIQTKLISLQSKKYKEENITLGLQHYYCPYINHDINVHKENIIKQTNYIDTISTYDDAEYTEEYNKYEKNIDHIKETIEKLETLQDYCNNELQPHNTKKKESPIIKTPTSLPRTSLLSAGLIKKLPTESQYYY